MKRSILLLLCLCGFILPGKLFSQNTVISGVVLDQQNKPIENAIVALEKSKDSSLVKVMFTDKGGNYRFENIDGERFIISVSMPGRKTITRKFTVEEGEQKEMSSLVLVILGKGETNSASPILTAFDNKFVLDVEGSGVKIKGTAWDVLKTIPSISENENGQLCFEGKSAIMIEFDGKQSDMGKQALKNKLKDIPASEISGLEISQQTKNSNGKPVINIVTVEGAKKGFYGAVSTGVDYGKSTQTSDGFEFNYRTAKMNFFGSYDYSKKPSNEITVMSTTFYNDGLAIDFQDDNRVIKKPISHEAMVGFDYTGNKGLSFGLEMSAEQIREKGLESDSNKYTIPAFDTTLFDSRAYTTENNDGIKMAKFNVKQVVKPMGAIFSSEFTFANDNSNWNETYPIEVAVAGTHNQTVETFRRYVGGNNYSISKGSFKYVQRFNDKFITIAGVSDKLTTSASMFNIERMNAGNWVNEGIQTQTYGFKQELKEAYFIGYLDFGKLSIIASVEAQQSTSTGVAQSIELGKQKSGIQYIPSLSIDHTINARNSFNYSFTQTVSRPSFRDLDPTARFENSYTYFIGNPNLRPEITNNAKIVYKHGSFLSVSAGMDLLQNGIQRVSYIDENGTLFHTKENLSKSRKTSVAVTTLLPIGNNILFQNKFSVNFSSFQADIYGMSINSNTHSYSASSELLIELPCKFILDVNGYYLSATSNGIMQTDAMGMLNASISKTMLQDKLEIEVGFNDILNTGSINAKFMTQDGPVSYHYNPQSQSVSVTAKYSFGNVKSQREE